MKKFMVLIFAFVSNTPLAGETPNVNICLDCHGPKGVSGHDKVPTIAGASAYFIESSLFAYKDEIRPSVQSKFFYGDTLRPETDMKTIVEKLSDEEISDIANYFSKQPFVPAKQPFNKDLVSLGKKIHAIRCDKCHGDNGTSADDDSGILAGQWTYYLKQSMDHYKDGSRQMEKDMKKKIDKLSDKQWLALLAYYASQQ